MILKCENVSLSYDGKTVAEKINFEICRGDYLCILGENGSGKTTLINALLGLKKTAGGKIVYGVDEIEKQKKSLEHMIEKHIFQSD